MTFIYMFSDHVFLNLNILFGSIALSVTFVYKVNRNLSKVFYSIRLQPAPLFQVLGSQVQQTKSTQVIEN